GLRRRQRLRHRVRPDLPGAARVLGPQRARGPRHRSVLHRRHRPGPAPGAHPQQRAGGPARLHPRRGPARAALGPRARRRGARRGSPRRTAAAFAGVRAAPPAPSHVRGETAPPLLHETVGQLLARGARTWPEGDALVVPPQGVRWTWREFDEAVTRVAAGLLALGLAPGDRVGIWSLNRAEWVLLQFATARAGLILVNINPAYRTHELEYALAQIGCSALALPAAHRGARYLDMLRELVPGLDACAPGALHAARLPALRHVILLGDEGEAAGAWRFDAIAACDEAGAHHRLAALQDTLDPHDAVNIQFTSGTTGAPKGATLTHHNIVNNGFFVGERMRLGPADRLCIPVPL